MTEAAARVLQERLGLSDDELLTILDVDPLTLITGGDELLHRPEIGLLLALTADREPSLLRIWVRNGAIDRLLARDFGAFETELERL
ncbi:MAG: hypothetical protein JWM71_2494 [Solirubrobacteraceae bacterium]|nr:hypothetical protein [Solirubrobacteraceae bacterium]